MNKKLFKIVYYEIINKRVDSVLTVYKGTHEDCLNYYNKNIEKYQTLGQNLSLMFI